MASSPLLREHLCNVFIPPNEVAEFAAAHDEANLAVPHTVVGLPRDTDTMSPVSVIDLG